LIVFVFVFVFRPTLLFAFLEVHEGLERAVRMVVLRTTLDLGRSWFSHSVFQVRRFFTRPLHSDPDVLALKVA